jgi:G protein-coupled receptor 19
MVTMASSRRSPMTTTVARLSTATSNLAPCVAKVNILCTPALLQSTRQHIASSTTSLPNDEGDDELVATAVYTLSLAMFWVPAIIANCLLCVVIRHSRRLQSTTNYFVMSMSTSDLLLSTLYLPLFVASLPRFASQQLISSGTCKCLALMEHILPASVLFVLVGICIDRFYTIIYPLSFKVTRGRAKRMIGTCWTLALTLSCAFLFLYDIDDVNYSFSTPRCGGGGGRWTVACLAIIYFAVVYITPMCILIYGYTRIFRYIWRVNTRWRFQRTTNAVTPAKAAMVKLIICVTCACLLLLYPFGLHQLVADVPSVHPREAGKWTVVWFYYASTVVKPGLYLAGNATFRRGCREVLCCWSSRCYRRSAYAITKATIFSRVHHVGFMVDNAPSAVSSPVMRTGAATTSSGDSPSRVFNRASKLMTSKWPLAVREGTSMTYM